MADALRATVGVPGFHAAAQVHFVETSPALREAQARAVPRAQWHDTADALPQAPLFLIANEFFDALPVRAFRRMGLAWAELMVGRDGERLILAWRRLCPWPGWKRGSPICLTAASSRNALLCRALSALWPSESLRMAAWP